VKGNLGPAEIDKEALRDPEILRLSIATALREAPEFNARFPAERYAQVSFFLRDGRTLVSGETRTRGDPESALSDAELQEKFQILASETLDAGRCARIAERIEALATTGASAVPLMDDLLAPISRSD
jgi:2-methylcitrate dehydratase PrpD